MSPIRQSIRACPRVERHAGNISAGPEQDRASRRLAKKGVPHASWLLGFLLIIAVSTPAAAQSFDAHWYCTSKQCEATMGAASGVVRGFPSEDACNDWRQKCISTSRCIRAGGPMTGQSRPMISGAKQVVTLATAAALAGYTFSDGVATSDAGQENRARGGIALIASGAILAIGGLGALHLSPSQTVALTIAGGVASGAGVGMHSKATNNENPGAPDNTYKDAVIGGGLGAAAGFVVGKVRGERMLESIPGLRRFRSTVLIASSRRLGIGIRW